MKRMKVLSILVLSIVSLGCAARVSQTELRTHECERELDGRWIRVHTSSGKTLEGRLVGIEGDSVLVLRQEQEKEQATRIRYDSVDEVTWQDYKRTIFLLAGVGVAVYVGLVLLFSANWY